MIKMKIDLMKIDKDLIFNAESGAKYLELVAIETPNSKYNDYMICCDLPKERREAGETAPIIGNGSRRLPPNQPNDQQTPPDVSAADNGGNEPRHIDGTADDLPF